MSKLITIVTATKIQFSKNGDEDIPLTDDSDYRLTIDARNRLDRLQAQVCSVRGSLKPTCKSPYEENSTRLFCLSGCLMNPFITF